MPQLPRIAVVTRSFGNTRDFEGLLVKAGTRFAVAAPIEGLKQLKSDRYLQLARVHLVRPLPDDETETVAAPAPQKTIEAKPMEVEKHEGRPPSRAVARKRQELDPPAPKRLNPQDFQLTESQHGSPIGSPVPALSLEADQALNTSKLSSRPRGRPRRGSNG